MKSSRTSTYQKKLVIVGNSGCGKTSLLLTHVFDKFPREYIPTVTQPLSSSIHVSDVCVELVMYDTLAQEDYNAFRHATYPDTDVILIAFGIECMDSFEKVLDRWVGEIKAFLEDVPIILLGLKKDLRLDGYGMITYDQGMEMAEKIGAVQYLECSSLTREGLNEVFECAAKYLIQRDFKSILTGKRKSIRQRLCRVM